MSELSELSDDDWAEINTWIEDVHTGSDGFYIESRLVVALRDEVERLREIVQAVAESHSVVIGSQAALVSRKHNLEQLRHQARTLLGLTD